MIRRVARAGIPVLALAVVLALAGCTSAPDDLASEYGDRGAGNYISGDGSVRTIAAADRGAAVEFGGTTDAGERVSSDDLAGRVVVLNFWYAQCPPCREEAPELEELHQQFLDDDVTFLGVNTSDTAATSQAFADEHGVTYPSILDADTREVLVAFSGQVPPNAVPTTLVLDRDGRVAARFSGLVTSPSVLAHVIEQTLAEGS